MIAPEKPDEELQRLATLKTLRILDTPAEPSFDRLTRLAARLFDVPIALVSIVDADRQWFKSRTGLDAPETHRDISFCGHAILQDDIFEIQDASEDERFHDNPLVTEDPNIRFYAGRPLQAQNGMKLGTLCLIDRKPKALTDDDKKLLDDLAELVEREMAVAQMATVDDLTGLFNRRGFMMLSQHHLNIRNRTFKPVTLIYLDLDKFKPINDNCGHQEGDLALQAFARGMDKSFRDSDVLARLGGDEFVILQTDSTSREANIALDRLKKELADWCQQEQKAYGLEFSAGVVDFDSEQHKSIEDMLAEGDRRMYQNKGL